MNKYTILMALNLPLAFYGLANVILSYKLKKLRPSKAAIRILFWSFIIVGIVFARKLSHLVYSLGLTDSPPFSIFDVILVTGVMLSFSLVARAHGKIKELETRFTLLHEKISIANSIKDAQ
jgi:hypothetical protein